jgi:hypothetical protein
MKKLLSKRKHLSIVRLELGHKVCGPLESLLLDRFFIKKNQVFVTNPNENELCLFLAVTDVSILAQTVILSRI